MEYGLQEECGVFACVAAGDWPTELDVSNIIYLGLLGIQHRGQESAGITVGDGESCLEYKTHKNMGLVSEVFNEEIIAKLQGNLGIGHTRYSTSGGSLTQNCQPFVVETSHGCIALAHNGELVNTKTLKKELLDKGLGLTTSSDSELIIQLLCHPPHEEKENDGPDWVSRITYLMQKSLTAYSLVVMYKDEVYAIRDPFGNRPLCLGRIRGSNDSIQLNSLVWDGFVVSSESCSFASIGAEHFRDVYPGEIVRLKNTGIESLTIVHPPDSKPTAFCIFEYVYFARADSRFEGQSVYSARFRCGVQLAKESYIEADLVSTVPESATPSALGYAQQSGIPYIEVLCKNRYVGRTFIQPNDRLRRLGVHKKFGALSDNIKGKRIVLLDDSIVRGNTMGPIVALLKNAGAKEVHIRIASPPLRYPCYMGINIPTEEELIANTKDLEGSADLESFIAGKFNANSVKYLSVGGLLTAIQSGIEDFSTKSNGHCTACLTKNYPVKLDW